MVVFPEEYQPDGTSTPISVIRRYLITFKQVELGEIIPDLCAEKLTVSNTSFTILAGGSLSYHWIYENRKKCTNRPESPHPTSRSYLLYSTSMDSIIAHRPWDY